MKELEKLLNEIRHLRNCSISFLGVKVHDNQASMGKLAALFGLKDLDYIYIEIPLEEASAILTQLLHKDMAYDSQILPLGKASDFVARIMNQIDSRKAHFYTNRRLGSSIWNPATEATFDNGILILQEEKIICIWFGDED
ncbi:MAG: hypothetical protein J0L77_05810 [Alphaproteobacteria bacterium]|nr:hypothetical protein [Alphaproteobacteria bacterium]